MTPSEHRAVATELLARIKSEANLGGDRTRDRITAHALLAKASGTGNHYEQADAYLTLARAAIEEGEVIFYNRNVAQALLHAHLADLEPPSSTKANDTESGAA